MITSKCPRCRTGLRLPEALRGKRVRCPRCKGVMRLRNDWYARLARPGRN